MDELVKNLKYRPINELISIDYDEKNIYKFPIKVLDVVRQNIDKLEQETQNDYDKLILRCFKSSLYYTNTNEQEHELYNIVDYVVKCMRNNGETNIRDGYVARVILETIYKISSSNLGDEILEKIEVKDSSKAGIMFTLRKVSRMIKSLVYAVIDNKIEVLSFVGAVTIILLIIFVLIKKVPIIGKFLMKIYGGVKSLLSLPKRLIGKLLNRNPENVQKLFEQYVVDKEVRKSVNRYYKNMNNYCNLLLDM